jgi:hypothetical protein
MLQRSFKVCVAVSPSKIPDGCVKPWKEGRRGGKEGEEGGGEGGRRGL